MDKTPLEKNSIYCLILFIRDFLGSVFQSIVLFFRAIIGKNPRPLAENRFLDGMNFALHIGPKGFWKAPSGLKIGRSPATLIHYIFAKDDHFQEKSPKKKF